MLYSHYLAVIGNCSNFQTLGDSVRGGCKRMIARYGSALAYSPEDWRISLEAYERLLAVHEFLCIGDIRSVSRTYSLMTKTNTESRYLL